MYTVAITRMVNDSFRCKDSKQYPKFATHAEAVAFADELLEALLQNDNDNDKPRVVIVRCLTNQSPAERRAGL